MSAPTDQALAPTSPVPFIDWPVAVRTAARLAAPGPNLPVQQAREVVADLYRHARTAAGLVAKATGLPADPTAVEVLVVDRPGWVRANAAAFELLLEPLVGALTSRQDRQGEGKGASANAKLSGVQIGTALAFLSTKVLGQYELVPPGVTNREQAYGQAGRLLLVAPNVVKVERELGVDEQDFRLWVCIHEQTHRLQFAAVPWLREYLVGLLHEVVRSADTEEVPLSQRLREVSQHLRGGRGSNQQEHEPGDAGLASRLAGPAQREVVARITAVMSLLEGHADYVMDSVGPQVIPSVEQIRGKFTRRREHAKWPERLLRRLFGMDAKLRQYRQGAEFVRTVVQRVGLEGFNRVWTSPNTLPSPAEIDNPGLWLARVHGLPASDSSL